MMASTYQTPGPSTSQALAPSSSSQRKTVRWNDGAASSSSATPGQIAPRRPTAPPSSTSSTSSAAPASVSRPLPSPTAQRSRLQWNILALLLLFRIPRLPQSKRIYWSLLDAIYSAFGGHADEQLDSALAWGRWAAGLVFLINVGEVGLQMAFHGQQGEGQVGKKRVPSLARPPGSEEPVKMTPPPSSATRSSAAADSPARRYSPHSPLRASLEAAARNAASTSNGSSPLGPRTSSSGSPSSILLQQRRLPSGPPSNATPLAAYLARRSLSSSSHPADQSGLSVGSIGDDSLGDVSSDSFEVDRALRVLSGSYLREQMMAQQAKNQTSAATTAGANQRSTDIPAAKATTTTTPTQAGGSAPPQTPLFQRASSEMTTSGSGRGLGAVAAR